jgi:hypothetical protein
VRQRQRPQRRPAVALLRRQTIAEAGGGGHERESPDEREGDGGHAPQPPGPARPRGPEREGREDEDQRALEDDDHRPGPSHSSSGPANVFAVTPRHVRATRKPTVRSSGRTLDSPPVSRVTSTCSLRSRISMARPAKITPVSVAIAGEGSEGRRQSQA